MRRVPGTKIAYRESSMGGLESTWDDGETWHFTFRGWREVEEMHPSIEPATEPPSNEDAEREAFGETLDEAIPDDLWDMIQNCT